MYIYIFVSKNGDSFVDNWIKIALIEEKVDEEAGPSDEDNDESDSECDILEDGSELGDMMEIWDSEEEVEDIVSSFIGKPAELQAVI